MLQMTWWKGYRIDLAWRLLLIAALSIALGYTIWQTGYIVLPIAIGSLLVIAIFMLYQYLDQTHRDISSTVLAIRQGDFTKSFKRLKHTDTIHQALDRLMDEVKQLNIQKNVQHQYLQTVVEQVPIALISYRSGGAIDLINPAFKTLFQLPYLHTLEQLSHIDEHLPRTIEQMHPGEKSLVKVVRNGELLSLAIQANSFTIGKESYRILTFQNIKTELDEQEVDAWQKLIRVLTHEISNSVMPIASLSKLGVQLLATPEGTCKPKRDIEADDLEDVFISLTTIQNRSQGMMHFVDAYRSLTHVPRPSFSTVAIQDFCRELSTLKEKELVDAGIQWQCEVDTQDTFVVDKDLLLQVFINLINNARDAMKGNTANPTLRLTYQRQGEKIWLSLADNGPGMDAETMHQIFIPFFTTKPNGSGIGLSLSRQIVRAHKGRIIVRSVPKEGTTFTIEL